MDLLELAAPPMALQHAYYVAGGKLRADGKYRSPLGRPSKMPGASYGLPAAECNVGSRMRASSQDTVCKSCYALKGNYVYTEVQAAQYRRLESITDPRWTESMVRIIGHHCKRVPFFRWHDSGDLQSREHLAAIVEIAQRLPDVSFWIPTREARLVRDWLETEGPFPSNLAVRVSVPMVDASPSLKGRDAGRLFSTVSRVRDAAPGEHRCPAPQQDNACGDCRACWSPEVSWVNYHIH